MAKRKSEFYKPLKPNTLTRSNLFKELQTAIYNLKYNQVLSIIKDFKKRDWDFTSPRYPFNENALHIASKAGALDIAKYLIEEEGFRPTTESEAGFTAYHNAAYYNHVYLLEYLTTKVKFNDPTVLLCQAKRTILHSSLRNDSPTIGNECFNYLIDIYGHNKKFINAQDRDGMTALHFAVEGFNLYAVKTLLNIGADTQLVSRNGKTAQAWAVYKLFCLNKEYTTEGEKKRILVIHDIIDLFVSHDNAVTPEVVKVVNNFDDDKKNDLNVKYEKLEEANDLQYRLYSPRNPTSEMTPEPQGPELLSSTSRNEELELTGISQTEIFDEPLESEESMMQTKKEYIPNSEKKKIDPEQKKNLDSLWKVTCERMDRKDDELRQDLKILGQELKKLGESVLTLERRLDDNMKQSNGLPYNVDHALCNLGTSYNSIFSQLEQMKAQVQQTSTYPSDVMDIKKSLAVIGTNVSNLQSRVQKLEEQSKEQTSAITVLKEAAKNCLIFRKKLYIEDPEAKQSPSPKRLKLSTSVEDLNSYGALFQ